MTRAEPETHPARVIETQDATPLLRLIRVQYDTPGLAARYEVPGQYVKVSHDGAAATTMALAQAPGRPDFELLVKRGTPAADGLVALGAGAALGLGPVQGKGFALHEGRGHDVLLFAAGSGIAPIRALIQTIAADRASYGKVRLYEGQREPQDFGFAGERTAWHAAGIETVEVLSRPHGDWSGRSGYVQAALLDDRPDVDRTVAYLCGMKGMVEAVRATLLTMGLPRERTHLNY